MVSVGNQGDGIHSVEDAFSTQALHFDHAFGPQNRLQTALPPSGGLIGP